jgi:hypothetical protein
VPSLGDYRFEHVFPMWFEVHLSLEQECRYLITLECILDNLVAITCCHHSLLDTDTFESRIALV